MSALTEGGAFFLFRCLVLPPLPCALFSNFRLRDFSSVLFFIASASRHPNLNLTPEEKRVFYQLFQAADTTNLGVITGEVAVPFFEKTNLSPEALGLVRLS